ncbi:MAG: hypothetical protein CME13_21640 [Gemmatimonadetes bacterium]|jgi:protein-disulfide isomerase|nr:hypothetical protein [Gemmatimonadota bacterium]|tara:strand:- start:318 stop:1409 length:1092 start_codon:yes stop_codon:yes gene_type:complete
MVALDFNMLRQPEVSPMNFHHRRSPVHAGFIGSVALAILAASCSPPAPKPDPAAQINDQTITLEQVDARVEQAEPEAWQSLFEARQRALAYLIDEQLLTEEATRQGVERDSLVRREVLDQLVAVSDSAVAQFYEKNRQRLGGQQLGAVRERIRQYLASENHRTAWLAYVGSLRDAAQIDVVLDPPRAVIAVGSDEPSKGPDDAPILLVEYSDYECPYCSRAKSAVRQVMETYGDKVRLVFRVFPLTIHPHARLAAEAGLCAQEQDRFWDYHDILFSHQRELRSVDLARYAAEIGLDTNAFDVCLESGRFTHLVDADLASGTKFGVTGTPAFFINGRRLTGAQPFSAFQQIIDDELERLERVSL